MSEQGDDETTPKKKRKTSTTSTSLKKWFSYETRMSEEKPSDFSDIMVQNSVIERWDDEKKEFDGLCAHVKSYFDGKPPPGFDRDKVLERHAFLRKKIKSKSDSYDRVKLGLQRSREHLKVLRRCDVKNMAEDILRETMDWRDLKTRCLERLKLFVDHEDSENKSKNIQDDLAEKNNVFVELESTKTKTTKNDAKESFFELRVTIY